MIASTKDKYERAASHSSSELTGTSRQSVSGSRRFATIHSSSVISGDPSTKQQWSVSSAALHFLLQQNLDQQLIRRIPSIRGRLIASSRCWGNRNEIVLVEGFTEQEDWQ
jgi:hypothetical protein